MMIEGVFKRCMFCGYSDVTKKNFCPVCRQGLKVVLE